MKLVSYVISISTYRFQVSVLEHTFNEFIVKTPNMTMPPKSLQINKQINSVCTMSSKVGSCTDESFDCKQLEQDWNTVSSSPEGDDHRRCFLLEEERFIAQ
jgi:hypothetical protein